MKAAQTLLFFVRMFVIVLLRFYKDKTEIHLINLITVINTMVIRYYLAQLSESRFACRKPKDKPGKASVTYVDYLNDFIAATLMKRFFPNTSLYCEEIILLKQGAESEMGQDPVDGTSLFASYNDQVDLSKSWITTMTFYAEPNMGKAFGLGLPLRNEIYYGNLSNGIFRNGKRYYVPEPVGKILIGIFEKDYTSIILKYTGRESCDIAGMTSWLILQGVARGGMNWFHEYHEGRQLEALIRCIEGSIVDLDGNPYALPLGSERAKAFVWALKPNDLPEILALAQKQRDDWERENGKKLQ